MSYCITLADTSVLVVDPERLDRLLPEMDKMKAAGLKRIVLIRSQDAPGKSYKGLGVEVVTMEDMLAELEREFAGKEVDLPDVDPDPEDDATILFTSGGSRAKREVLGCERHAGNGTGIGSMWADSSRSCGQAEGLVFFVI